jgi:HAD superfamily hydrolase (TIGR01509 family)
VPDAVIFDLDGVLLDSEQAWNEAKEALVRASGGTWRDEAPVVMMGMSSPEWSAYLRDDLGVPMDADAINRDVVARMEERYARALPLLPGAAEAVRALGARWPLGLASSSNREIIDRFLELSGFGDAFRVTISSEEVPRGKPAPDVYVEAVRRLGADSADSVAVEDSENGIRAARAAGMRVVAVPNPHYPPDPAALAEADEVVRSLHELTVERVLG